MNIKQFYSEITKKEEELFMQRTGLKIRRSFQKYTDGTNNDEVFSLQSSHKRECIGVDFNGCVFYLQPCDNETTYLFIFDDSFNSLLEVMSDWSEARFKVFCKHVQSFANAIENGGHSQFSDYAILLEDDMLCFARQLYYPILDKIEEGYLIEPELINELTALIQFRNQCKEEIQSFSGFSTKDENEILLREGFKSLKRGLRIMRLTDFNSNN